MVANSNLPQQPQAALAMLRGRKSPVWLNDATSLNPAIQQMSIRLVCLSCGATTIQDAHGQLQNLLRAFDADLAVAKKNSVKSRTSGQSLRPHFSTWQRLSHRSNQTRNRGSVPRPSMLRSWFRYPYDIFLGAVNTMLRSRTGDPHTSVPPFIHTSAFGIECDQIGRMMRRSAICQHGVPNSFRVSCQQLNVA